MAPERSPQNVTTATATFTALMNQHPKYEQTIAGKLQSLPVPDMADAIWSRIEAQLDIDLPTNDGGGTNPSSSSPAGPGIIGWGLSVVVIALISIFLLVKNKKESNSKQTSNPVKETMEQPIRATKDRPPTNKDNQQSPVSSNNPVIDNRATVQADSVAQAPVANNSDSPDTSSINKAQPLVVTQPPVEKDTIPTGKKKRGVSGLTDNDYRIEPKKDN